MAAIYQAQAPWCSIIVRKVFGVAGAAHQNWNKFNFRYAWPSGDWGSLPLEGGIEAAYKADLAASDDPEGEAAAGDRGAHEQGALALPHRRDLRRRGDHRPARHARRCCASSPISPRRCARPVPARDAASVPERAAFYLERYPATAEGLRRVLNRRVRKAQMLEAPIVADVRGVIDAIVAKFVDSGAIDDRAFAQTKARALHRRGVSTKGTRQKLRLAGVDDETLDAALAGLDRELDVDPGQREWTAAVALARRRRLGPFRQKDRAGHRDRDLAVMGRAGFDYDLARKVIDARDRDIID
jgi:regulatory protein